MYFSVISDKVKLSYNNEKNFYELKESKPSVIRKVKIRVKSEKCVCFKLDIPKKRLSYYLNASISGIQAAVDGIVITETKENFICYLIELKSSKVKKQDIINKFQSTISFLDYLSAIWKNFYGISKPFIKKYILISSSGPVVRTSNLEPIYKLYKNFNTACYTVGERKEWRITL